MAVISSSAVVVVVVRGGGGDVFVAVAIVVVDSDRHRCCELKRPCGLFRRRILVVEGERCVDDGDFSLLHCPLAVVLSFHRHRAVVAVDLDDD